MALVQSNWPVLRILSSRTSDRASTASKLGNGGKPRLSSRPTAVTVGHPSHIRQLGDWNRSRSRRRYAASQERVGVAAENRARGSAFGAAVALKQTACVAPSHDEATSNKWIVMSSYGAKSCRCIAPGGSGHRSVHWDPRSAPGSPMLCRTCFGCVRRSRNTRSDGNGDASLRLAMPIGFDVIFEVAEWWKEAETICR